MGGSQGSTWPHGIVTVTGPLVIDRLPSKGSPQSRIRGRTETHTWQSESTATWATSSTSPTVSIPAQCGGAQYWHGGGMDIAEPDGTKAIAARLASRRTEMATTRITGVTRAFA